jgi:DNA topoisomerase-1
LENDLTKQSLSAGRVQSAALQMIINRYKNAIEHVPEIYWICEANFKLINDIILCATTYEKSTDKIMYWATTKNSCKDFEKILNLFICNHTIGWNIKFTNKIVHKNPSAPFTTSTFQQEVYNLYHISSKIAMQSAQRLYEGGFITYMRTDSVQLSKDSQQEIIKYITHTYGHHKVNAREFKTKQQNAQEAHEAIRPSNPETLPKDLPDTISEIDRKIYSLIWRRTISSQMIAAEYNEITYIIDIPVKEIAQLYYFKGTLSLLTKKGYQDVYSPDITIDKEALLNWEKILNTNCNSKQVFLESLKGLPYVTKSKSLYNEASIIKAFEKEGIGRPSTYATILDKLYIRQYISKGEFSQKDESCDQYTWDKNIGLNIFTCTNINIPCGSKDKDLIIPTSLGIRVIEFLEPYVPFLLDTAFTSHMESDLDKIMKAETSKEIVLNNFYKIFHSAVIKAKNTMAEKTNTKLLQINDKKSPDQECKSEWRPK